MWTTSAYADTNPATTHINTSIAVSADDFAIT